jgi:hypothetical protein
VKRTPIAALLLGVGLAGMVFACSPGPSSPKAVGPEYAMPPPPVPTDPRVQEIQDYWMEIKKKRGDLDLDLFPSAQMIQGSKSYDFENKLCPDHDSMTKECDENCNLADHICDNAEEICRIAGDLRNTANHAWAAEKCDQGRASCKEARQKCCDCNAKNSDDDTDASGTW